MNMQDNMCHGLSCHLQVVIYMPNIGILYAKICMVPRIECHVCVKSCTVVELYHTTIVCSYVCTYYVINTYIAVH